MMARAPTQICGAPRPFGGPSREGGRSIGVGAAFQTARQVGDERAPEVMPNPVGNVLALFH
jgi:hypothetical protein